MDNLETKVAGATDYSDVLVAFEAFKEANDERLDGIEKRMSADVVTTEKMERINKALDELILKSRRPQLSTEPKNEPSEHKRAFDAYVRKGDALALNAIEAKAMSVGSGADGGYLAPAETATEIARLISKASLRGAEQRCERLINLRRRRRGRRCRHFDCCWRGWRGFKRKHRRIRGARCRTGFVINQWRGGRHPNRRGGHKPRRCKLSHSAFRRCGWRERGHDQY